MRRRRRASQAAATAEDGSATWVRVTQTTLDVQVARTPLPAEESPDVVRQDQVTLSARASALYAEQVLVRRTLDGVEAALSPPLAPFEPAGRAEYLAFIDDPDDLSPEARADRILGGITGYLLEAWERAGGGAPDLEEYVLQAWAGCLEGLTSALRVLQTGRAQDARLAADAERLARHLRRGLAALLAEPNPRRPAYLLPAREKA